MINSISLKLHFPSVDQEPDNHYSSLIMSIFLMRTYCNTVIIINHAYVVNFQDVTYVQSESHKEANSYK